MTIFIVSNPLEIFTLLADDVRLSVSKIVSPIETISRIVTFTVSRFFPLRSSISLLATVFKIYNKHFYY